MYCIEVRRGDGKIVGGEYTVYTNKATAETVAAKMRGSFQGNEISAAWTVEVVEVRVIDW